MCRGLEVWRNGKRKRMPFTIQMVWKEGNDYITDGYFCLITLKRINRKNKHHVQYSYYPSAIRPILHRPYLAVLDPNGSTEYTFDSEHSDMTVVAADDAYKAVLLTQGKLKNLTRKVNLSK